MTTPKPHGPAPAVAATAAGPWPTRTRGTDMTSTSNRTRAHGTLARYVMDRCRCKPCTAAAVSYGANRARLIAYGRWAPYVDAEPTRQHARTLMELGIGWQRLARIAGVPNGAMSKLLYGGPGDRPPSRRIRQETSRKILAVEPSLDLLGAAVTVDATGTARRLQALIAIGWSQAKLADRLGVQRSNFGRTLTSPMVTAETARKVRGLYDELWDQAPPEDNRWDRAAAVRARSHAQAKGWVPPLAWDDDQIDDPTATPDLGTTGSRGEALAENAYDLVTRFGCSPEEAAARLGVQVSYVKRLDRMVSRSRAVA